MNNTKKYKMNIEEIAYENDLKIISTTGAMNGYPTNIQKAIIGFDNYEQAANLALTHNLEIQSFTKKDGWQLWYRTGNLMFGPLKYSPEDFGNDYSSADCENEADFIDDYLKPNLDFNNFETIEEYEQLLNNFKELWEEIQNADAQKEIVITHNGLYYDTLPRETMQHNNHDTRTTVIGLINPNF